MTTENRPVNSELELKIQRSTIIEQARNVFEVLPQLRQDVRANIVGKKAPGYYSLHEDTYMLAAVCGLSEGLMNKWAHAMVRPQDETLEEESAQTSFRQYLDFFDSFSDKTYKEFGQIVEGALEGKDRLVPFFNRLVTINPLVGTTAVLLYDQACRDALTGRHEVTLEEGTEGAIFSPASEWYRRTVEHTAETSEHIDNFFNQVNGKVATATKEDSSLTTGFLNDWREDLQLNLAETISSASCSAIHLHKSDCAVFTTTIPVEVIHTGKVREEIMSLQGPEEYDDGRVPIYRGTSSYIFENLNEHLRRGEALLPIASSVVDTVMFASRYKEFWKQALNGLNAKKSKITEVNDETGAYKIKLGDAVTFLLRAEQAVNKDNIPAQARIALQGEAAFEGFGIRIDNEPRGVTLDIGGIGYPEMFAYAESIKKLDEKAECVMGYSRIVGARGNLKGRRGFYPSVMENNVSYVDPATNTEKQLSLGHRMGLLAAIKIQDGASLGTRMHNFYSYHARENVGQNQEYADRFKFIVGQLKEALSARS